MIRFLSVLSIACLGGGIALLVTGSTSGKAIGALLLVAAFAITGLLAIRHGYHRARGFVSDARNFISGDIQHARLVEVRDPRGIFSPESTVVLELEGEDGALHRFEHEIPVPFPIAWSYRLGKRFNLPLLGGTDLSELMAFELRREGMDVSVGRKSAATAESTSAA